MNNIKASMGLKRHFLKPSTYLPTAACEIDMNRLFQSLNGTDLTKLVMDDTMSPDFKGMTFNYAVRQLAWAKINDKQISRSLLTVLTNGGSLSLYILVGNEWVEVNNISKSWYAKSAPLWTTLPDSPSCADLLKSLRERSYRLKITAFAWTGSKSTTNLLFTASMDGILCAWEVSLKSDTNELEVEMLSGLETGHTRITSLAVIQTDECKCMLIYSLFSGQIHSISVTITDVVEFSDTSEIWEEKDGIVVPPGGMIAEMILGYVMLAVGKGPHLLVFLITAENQILSYTTFHSGDVSITGLHFISSTELFLTTWSGKINMLSVTVETDATISVHATNVKGLNKTDNLGIMGVAFSRSKAIIAMAYSVKVNFNHNFLKECSSTTFCTLPEIANLEKIKTHTGSLYEIWDVLELTRLGFLKKPDRDTQLLNSLIDLDQLDTMHITQLKKNLWLLNSLLTVYINGLEDEKVTYIELGKDIYNLVTARHIFNRATKLLDSPNRDPISEKSLRLMRRWLIYFESNLDTDNFPSTNSELTSVLDSLNACQSACMGEVCAICDAGPEDDMITDMKSWKCFRGHELPRCSVSFLQCDKLPYYSCGPCSIIAHPITVEKEGYTTCIYCDGYLEKSVNII